MDLCAPLYCLAVLRAIALRPSGEIAPSRVIISAVSPSLRYCWLGFPLRSSNGVTRIVSRCEAPFACAVRLSHCWYANPLRASITTKAGVGAIQGKGGKPDACREGGFVTPLPSIKEAGGSSRAGGTRPFSSVQVTRGVNR